MGGCDSVGMWGAVLRGGGGLSPTVLLVVGQEVWGGAEVWREGELRVQPQPGCARGPLWGWECCGAGCAMGLLWGWECCGAEAIMGLLWGWEGRGAAIGLKPLWGCYGAAGSMELLRGRYGAVLGPLWS